MNKKVAVLDVIKKDRWVFRVSLLEDTDITSIMVVYCNIKEPTSVGIRFFANESDSYTFITECAAGKYGDSVDKE